MLKSTLKIASLTLALVVTGCATGSNTSSGEWRENAVVITGAHGQSTYIFDRATAKPVETRPPDATMCAACKADVAKYYTTGSLAPKCATCGAQRTIISHSRPHGH